MIPATVALALAGCQDELYRDLSQRDANEMVAVLASHGIQASREATDGSSYRIVVSPGSMPAAIEVLRRAGYPRERYRSLADVFPADGLIVSPFEQRARMMYALNQEISRTLVSIDGVVTARVHVVMPELDLRGSPQSRASASVVIHHTPAVDPEDLAPKVRQLVANAVQGLGYRDVSIAFFATAPEGRIASVAPGLPFAGSRDTVLLAAALVMALGAAAVGWRSMRQKVG